MVLVWVVIVSGFMKRIIQTVAMVRMMMNHASQNLAISLGIEGHDTKSLTSSFQENTFFELV
jgi:hypothetical protein